MMTLNELKQKNDIPVVLADHQGIISYINKKFEAVWKWTEADLIGKPLTSIIPANLRTAHHLGFSRFLATSKPTLLNQPLKLKVMSKDGQESEAEHVIVAEKVDGNWAFGATIAPPEKK
jgi:PAS domain S-box-containing protein